MKVQRESEQLHGGHAPTHGHPRTRRHERVHSCCPAAVLPVSSAGPIGSRQLAVQPIADVQRGGRASDEAGGENPERRPLRARQHHQHRRFDPRPLQSDRRAGDEEDKPGNPRPPRPQRAVRTVHRGHVCEPYAGGRPAVPGAAGRFVSQTGGTGGPECRTERPGDPHQPDEGRGSAEQRLFRSEQPGLDFESPWQLRRPGGGPPDAVPAARVLSRPDPQPQKHGQKTAGSWDALSPAHCRFRAASMIQGRNFIDCGVVDTVYLIIITS